MKLKSRITFTAEDVAEILHAHLKSKNIPGAVNLGEVAFQIVMRPTHYRDIGGSPAFNGATVEVEMEI